MAGAGGCRRKDADIVVLNGTWDKVSSLVTRVYVDGLVAYDREEEMR